MKNWFRKNLLNFAIAGAIAIPLSIYGISQQPERIVSMPTEKIEYIENETEKAENETELKEVKYFDVPLSHDLQDFIFAECEEKNINPAIIVSMIERESYYNPDCIGDGGDSLGIMQIQSKWHYERMQRLECMDLLDPYQNIKVGIDYLFELIEKENGLYWALMAYNGGADYADRMTAAGKISDYALVVAAKAQELEKSIEN